MKKYAIIKIVIYSFVALSLTAVMIVGMCLNSFDFKGFSLNLNSYDDEGYETLLNTKTFESNNISSLDIDWTDGSIEIKQNSNNEFELSESSNKTISEDNALRYLVDNGTLKIKSRKSQFLWFDRSTNKTLTILVPQKQYNKILVDCVSANVTINDLQSTDLKIDSVSGEISSDNCKTNNLNIDTTSGEVNLQNTYATALKCDTTSGNITLNGTVVNSIDVDGISGDFDFTLDNCPNNINSDTVSGSMNINIPEDSGFVCDFDSVSGDFDSNFSTITQNDKYIVGDKSATFELESVSGDVSIEKQ